MKRFFISFRENHTLNKCPCKSHENMLYKSDLETSWIVIFPFNLKVVA